MSLKIVGISNCPVGIAHTYMVAQALMKEGNNRGHNIKIETQGALGCENKLSGEDIEGADCVILAVGRSLSDEELKKFESKIVITRDINEVLRDIDRVFDDLELEVKSNKLNNYKQEEVHFPKDEIDNLEKDIELNKYTSIDNLLDDKQKIHNTNKNLNIKNNIFKHIMHGISYTIPLAVAGGMLMVLSSSIYGIKGELSEFVYILQSIGMVGISLMTPILGAYIAYSIADKPALAPALLGSYLANSKDILGINGNSGFLGAIVVGILVGYFVKYLKKIKVHKNVDHLMGFIIIPVLATLIITTVVYYIIAPITSFITINISQYLNSMSSQNTIVVCAIVGIMTVLDMGGPINKAAYLFALGMVEQGNLIYFGTVAITNLMPPISVGIATFIKPNLFNKEEIEAGASSIIVGSFGITEPAIPYAVNDPIPIMSAQIISAIIAASIGCIFNVKRVAPGASIVDPLIGNITPMLGFYITVIIGVAINTLLVVLFKSMKLKLNNK